MKIHVNATVAEDLHGGFAELVRYEYFGGHVLWSLILYGKRPGLKAAQNFRRKFLSGSFGLRCDLGLKSPVPAKATSPQYPRFRPCHRTRCASLRVHRDRPRYPARCSQPPVVWQRPWQRLPNRPEFGRSVNFRHTDVFDRVAASSARLAIQLF